MKKFNLFHLVDLSLWPLVASLSVFSAFLGVIIMVRLFNPSFFLLSLVFIMFLCYFWGKDIHNESCYMGDHNYMVVKGMKTGMIIFILSECFFFFSMFWGYLHLAQSPALELGGVWPPVGVMSFDPKGVPFLNTMLLVSSGVSVTLCHHSMELGDYYISIISLIVTVFLGVLFSLFQGMEYYVASFTFSCGSYSSIYFMGTGFHGLHVIIGSVLLVISFYRIYMNYISPTRSVGFECSVWYWHFVDVVWFFLYLIFYWWGV